MPEPMARVQNSACKCGSGQRNLIVCIDGTSNKFSEKNTNVVELYSRLVKDKHQLTYYNSGIGTYATPSWKSLSYYYQKFKNNLDLAFALRFEKIIISAYAWLADNYKQGDRIFLFGFSRGAYQVRALSAMIHLLGLIHKGNDDQIPFAYELYAAGTGATLAETVNEESPPPNGLQPAADLAEPSPSHVPDTASVGSAPIPPATNLESSPRSEHATQPVPPENPPHRISSRLENIPKPAVRRTLISRLARALNLPTTTKEDVLVMQKRFHDAFCRTVQVHFVGAWDTVSSVGIARSRTLPGTTNGMHHACFFRHALALHEYRVKFLPEYVNGGYGPQEAGPVSLHVDEPREAGPDIKGGSAEQQQSPPPPPPPHTKEVWFPGSHSDIGGGANRNPAMTNFGHSLRWMSFEARLAGVRLKQETQIVSDSKRTITRSLKLPWRILEILPLGRLTYHTAEGTTHLPHFARSRVFQRDQLLSWDVTDDDKKLFGIEKMSVENDPYTDTAKFLKLLDEISEGHNDDIVTFRESLRSVLHSASGQELLCGVGLNIVPKLLKTIQKPEIAKDELRGLVLSAIFGLAFAFDGTDTEMIGRSPQLAARDFFQAVERHIASATSLDERELTMFKVLTELHAGRVALRKESSRAVAAIKRILAEIPEAKLNLFTSVTDILAISGVACPFDAFDANDMIIKPESCDVIAIGCVLLSVIRRCVDTKKLPQARECAMISFMKRTTQYTHGPALDSLNELLSPQLLSLLGLLVTEHEKQGAGDTVQVMIEAVQSILDGFALEINHDTCEARRLISILAPSRSEGRRPQPVSMSTEGTEGVEDASGSIFNTFSALLPISIPFLSWRQGTAPATRSSDLKDIQLTTSLDYKDIHASTSSDSEDIQSTTPFDAMDVQWTVPQLRGHEDAVAGVAFLPSGEAIVSASWDNTVRIWDPRTGRRLSPSSMRHDDDVNCVAVSPTGKIVSGSDDGVCIVWDSEGKEIRRSRPVGNIVYSLSVSAGEEYFAAGTHNGQVHIFNLAQPSKKPKTLPTVHDSQVFSLAYSPRDKNVLASSCCHFTFLWDISADSPKQLRHDSTADWVRSTAFSPDGKSLAIGSDDGLIRIWNVAEATLRSSIPTNAGTIYSISYAPNCRYIVTGCGDSAVRLWNAETGRAVGEPLWGHYTDVYSVAVSQDGSRIVSGSADKMVCIWDRVPFLKESPGSPLSIDNE